MNQVSQSVATDRVGFYVGDHLDEWFDKRPSRCELCSEDEPVIAAVGDGETLGACAGCAERVALRNLEVAARELDVHLSGSPSVGWRLGQARFADGSPVALALLSMHDYLNDVRAAREA